MRYFVTLETERMIFVFSYNHDRNGLDLAFKKIEKHRHEIVHAQIESERDGVIFDLKNS